MFKALQKKSKNKEQTHQNPAHRSKEDLRADHEAKSDELERLKTEYRRRYRLVEQLDSKFNGSKWKPTRYRRLKRMIKRCTDENALIQDSDEDEEDQDLRRKGTAELFRENAEKLERRQKELHETKKEEFIEKNEKLDHQVKVERDKYEHLDTRIERLKQDYTACKRYRFIQKYFVMKEIIKSFINDTSLPNEQNI